MPTFVFKCNKCGEQFEKIMKPADYTNLVRCPKCGLSNPRRVFTPPATPGLNKSSDCGLATPTRHFG